MDHAGLTEGGNMTAIADKATDTDGVWAVIPRDSIPALRTVEQDGVTHVLGELRDFRWHEELAAFLPPSAELGISWVRLRSGETLDIHVHPIQSMMIFFEGSGTLNGDLVRQVSAGDVVVVPPGCHHGFISGPQGLSGISIQFGEGLYTRPAEPRVLFADQSTSEVGAHAELLAWNRARIEEFGRLPVFDLLADGTLEDAARRKVYQDALQIWVDGNQTLLFSRQASVRDPLFVKVFFGHMTEELGHDVLHADRADGGTPDVDDADTAPFRDAIMEAITDWFAHQMFVLDDIEKAAVVHLVIENASSVYHREAMPVLAKYLNNNYFELHVEADDGHAAIGEELIRQAGPRTYQRLEQVLGEAWMMIGAMTNRLVELTRAG
jgi:quercetin dioxygenase-like cupin family protein